MAGGGRQRARGWRAQKQSNGNINANNKMKHCLRQGYGRQRKINRPLKGFWPVLFLIMPDTCQRVTGKYFKINMLKIAKNEKKGITGQNGPEAIFSKLTGGNNKKGGFSECEGHPSLRRELQLKGAMNGSNLLTNCSEKWINTARHFARTDCFNAYRRSAPVLLSQ